MKPMRIQFKKGEAFTPEIRHLKRTGATVTGSGNATRIVTLNVLKTVFNRQPKRDQS